MLMHMLRYTFSNIACAMWELRGNAAAEMTLEVLAIRVCGNLKNTGTTT